MGTLVDARGRGPRLRANCQALCLLLCFALMSGLAAAGQAAAPRLIVGEPWVRGTVEGQTGSGAYMRLTSREDLRIVGASSPAANKVEIHEMRMVDNRMTMRAVPSLALPANATVALEHGYHIMLIGLSQRLEVGQTVKITLHLIDAKGMPFDFDVLAPVRALNASSRRE